MSSITASAPGKILLLGGYAVLERPNVAYVLAVDKHVKATLQPLNEQEIIVDLPDFGFSIHGDAHQFSGSTEEREKAKFVIHAIRATIKYLEYKKIPWKGFKLVTHSDEAFQLKQGKSGLGSSAAVTVAAIAAMLHYHGIKDLEIVHKLAQFSHAYSQGKVGSGFDIAAACYGSIEYVRYSATNISFDLAQDSNKFGKVIESKWDYTIQKTQMPSSLHLAIANIIGTSASTSAMVKKLHAWKEKNGNIYNEIIHAINEADRLALIALRQNNIDAFAKHFNTARTQTKKLGEEAGIETESDGHTKLINSSLQNGALVCRLPGAGGGDSIVALCKSEGDKEKLEGFWKKRGLQVLRVQPIPDGLRVK